MEEERIKSAFEIAMERISGLPELTPEEIAEQKEREFKPIGLAIANKYLERQIAEDELKSALDSHRGEKGKIVRAALISALCQAVQLEDIPKAERALQAFAAFGLEEKDFEETQRDFMQARRDLEREIGIVQNKYEGLVRQELEDKGIRGGAVNPNLLQNEGWLQRLNAMRRTHDSKLAGVRKKLIEKLG